MNIDNHRETTPDGHPIMEWRVEASAYRATPSLGARLMSWDLSVAGNTRSVVYWPQENVNWQKPGSIRGGNPILFPFCGRSFFNGEIGQWKTPEGEICPMKQHGYARDGVFETESCWDKGFQSRYVPDDAAKKAYPYKYEFRIKYQFEALGFQVDMLLTNHDERPIPWSAGHHFYFTLPWHAAASRGDYLVELDAKKAFYHQEDGALAPAERPVHHTPANEPALRDRIHCQLRRPEARLVTRNEEEAVRVRTGGEQLRTPSRWETFVTWIENDDAPYYCLEPWMGPPNSTEHQNGLHFVSPGETGEFSCRVDLS